MESARTGHPIITSTFMMSMYINKQAKSMGVKIKQPISIKKYISFNKNRSLFHDEYWTGKILIDDVDLVLKELLNVEIKTVTCTPDNMEDNENMSVVFETIPLNVKYNKLEKIKNVNVIVPNKVVEVTFLDGTKEKSVCREPDVFSFEQAIGICISKKVMGGSSAYNNAVKRGIKVYENKIRKKEEDKEKQERIERKRAKKKAYKERRAAKKEQEEKEKQIEIQKEAYMRAMIEIENMKNNGV